MRPVNVFVAPRGNAFMTDIAGWIAEAAGLLGREATLRTDGAPPTDPAAINLVLAPHEYYLLADFDDATIHRAAQISVPVCTEQPGTPWFDIGTIPARVAPLVLDINAHGVAALIERGLPARHLRLGGVPSMNAAGPAGDVGRDIDLVYLAGNTDRRGARLATLAPILWDRTAELRLFSFTRPVGGDVPGLLFGADKYALLARSRILLNIHRDDVSTGSTAGGYFEWARFLEAMANGCCIVTEPVDGHAPFVAGEHFVVADDLAGTVAELLAEPDECTRVGAAAQRGALDEFPLTATLAPVLDELDGLVGHAPAMPRRVPKYGRHLRVAQRLPLLPPFRPNGDLRLDAFQAMAAETALQRSIERTRSLVRYGVEDHVEQFETPAYAAAAPEVSVIVTLFDYAHLVLETLESIVASQDVDFELIVVDDHSGDDGRAVVGGFLDAHPDVPIVLLGSDVNRGLAAGRNLGFATARADRVMVMDADNLVYPSCLRKLSDALDGDPSAAFAYATLECFGTRRGVASAQAWYVPWLTEANYIDAQTMVRKAAWERIGGYRTDDALVFGWEDWELWLRLAEAGEHGVHVPQMLGRYRTQAESMISTTNLVADHMLAHLRDLHPTLPWT